PARCRGTVTRHRDPRRGWPHGVMFLLPARAAGTARLLRSGNAQIRRRTPGARRAHMHRIDNDTPAIGRTVMVLMMLAAAVTSGMASASDEMEGRGRSARKIVMHDDELISPSALTMNRDDVLEFENDSGQLMRLVFVEPEDQREKVRCHLVNRTSARPDETPRLVLDWDAGT